MDLKQTTLLLILSVTVMVTNGDDSCPGLPMCFCNKDKTSVNCEGKHLTSVPDNIPENVTKLYLQYNNIIAIKANTFGQYKKLEKLYMKSNKVARIEPLAFAGTVSLQYIDLSGNKLPMIGHGAFAELPNLQSLYLSTNSLETVEEHAFNGTENLKYINLQSNLFMSIPNLGRQPKFEKIILQSNTITNATFPWSYSDSHSIQYIGLSSNKISILHNNTFRAIGNASIASLYLNSNKLTVVETGTFAGLASIQSLKLGQNPLNGTGLKLALKGLMGKNIVSLDISGLRLNGNLLEDTFKLLQDTTITSLDMRFNSLSDLPNGSFRGLDNLLHLDLSSCDVTKAGPSAFDGLDKLQILNLERNKLVEIPENLPPTLLRLFLDNNQITRVKGMVFKNLAYLQELRIRYNKLQVLMTDSFRGLISLNKLDLMNNYIATLPGSVFNPLVRLTSLNIGQNNLQQIQAAVDRFSSLGSLVYFNMADNNCFFVQKDVFKYMASLRYLHLERNNLGNLISSDFDGELFRGLAKLQELYLMDNNIVELQAPMFQDLSLLQRLNLTTNKVKTWGKDLFKTTPNLKYLDLTNNLVSVLKKENLQQFPNLQEMNLTGNPFVCGCDLRWFRDWINRTTIQFSNVGLYTCTEPKDWAGKPLLSFDRTKISCLLFTWQVLVGIGAGVFLVMVVIGVIMYRKRWSIQLRIYKFRRGKLSSRRAGDGRGTYGAIIDGKSYDAYISYADDDRKWVIQNILQGIDRGDYKGEPFGGQYSLYFADRDEEPGQPKMDNICVHMANSRKVIVVLSKNYLGDAYHKFELDQAIAAMYENKIQEVIVVYTDDGLPQSKIPISLTQTMRRHQMIEWSDNDDARELCRVQINRRLGTTVDAANIDTE